ncbi:DNA primase large subunit PriL [Methanocalculus sp.]|uniref:DNA primase large subunit PriL n=1 Tax=Methanocalculus sp. TaxID=2004547 RepID=UPI00271E8B37|nr:DNA primase large subunit PriL [Methanocalculus sp.]MDO8841536.1 DNA primase large subunit PriL [Methanocalculus sp.]
MKVRLELQDLAHYPFLKEAQEIIAERGISFEFITRNSQNQSYLAAAVNRIRTAMLRRENQQMTDADDPIQDIVSYALARILISCTKNRTGIGPLSRFEADRALYFLQLEKNQGVRTHLFRELGIPFSGGAIPYTRYIEIASTLREERYRLVNRDLSMGMVQLNPDEEEFLLRERIRTLLLDQLPLNLPASACSNFSDSISEIDSILSERTTEEYGNVDEGGFPPCIRALYNSALQGKYLSHSGRFALTTFLNTIGMETTGIISLFSGGGDFNLDMTTYQVDHIISHGDDGYTAPTCATMRTHGICVGKNKACELINHPLNYYRRQKKARKYKKSQPVEKKNSTTEGDLEKQK